MTAQPALLVRLRAAADSVRHTNQWGALGNAWNCYPCWPRICRCGNPKTFEEYQNGKGSGDADVGGLRCMREGTTDAGPAA